MTSPAARSTGVADRLRLLLLWPGGLFTGGKNFGVPQLLSIAAYVERETDARVDVIDLDTERALGPVRLDGLLAPNYDVIAIACYSSYEFLKVMALGQHVRRLRPGALLVSGGYHASARPDDFTGNESPFDHVVVGDGEEPIRQLVDALARGRPPTERVLGPTPVQDPNTLPPYSWEHLSRYRPVARHVASQAEIYLSRGCPFSCTFCMERAKRCTAWRPLAPERALDELHRLDAFLDLSQWTLFVADALFGMKASWCKEVLVGLASRPLRARKIWLLTRVDLLDREDLALMARANVAPGFGLEAADESQLVAMGKSRTPGQYLDAMRTVAGWARELDVPFGANILVGHPGDTEKSLRTTARYLRDVFLDSRGTHGFLSIDPFRLYPGSAIDAERMRWEQETGFRAHRYPWWHDGDQDFLSEWVDPSASLDFRAATRLRWELFAPIVRALAGQFAYRGPARDYFMRSIQEQVALHRPERRLRVLGLWHLWRELTEPISEVQARAARRADSELAGCAQQVRAAVLAQMPRTGSNELRQALECVPREWFVRTEDLPLSGQDRALALDDTGTATVSAMHAYAASFGALRLQQGDRLVDLGGGAGYGAAVAAAVVGPQGEVVSVEIDEELAAMARDNLAPWPWARVVQGDACAPGVWPPCPKVSVGFGVPSIPQHWLDAMPDGGLLVVPVGEPDAQRLTRLHRSGQSVVATDLGPVRYVTVRLPAQRPGA